MDLKIFSMLFERNAGYSLPVLIQLKHPGKITWYFTSNNTDVEFEGNIYKYVGMEYKFPSSKDGIPQGGTLEIDIDVQSGDNELLRWFDELDDRATIDVIALINEQNEIVKISQFTQSHGSVSWDGSKIIWSLGSDIRMNMQINPFVMDNDALTG